MGSLGQSLRLELALCVGRSRFGFSVFCDGKSLDQVPALTHLALLNGGLIIFIFKDCNNGCSASYDEEEELEDSTESYDEEGGSEASTETFRVRHLWGGG